MKIAIAVLLTAIVACNGLTLESSAYSDGGCIPVTYSCQNPNGAISIPFKFKDVPSSATSLSLKIVDLDSVPNAGFVHWDLSSIPATTLSLAANASKEGLGNIVENKAYVGMCPPNTPTHRYVATLTAFKDTTIVASANYTGLFAKDKIAANLQCFSSAVMYGASVLAVVASVMATLLL
eukprot:Colp12_sorted_trinity150504_noHs@3318